MKSLNEIVIEGQTIIGTIMAAEGELTPEIEGLYNSLTTDLANKLDCCAYIENKLVADAQFFKDQAKKYLAVAHRLDQAREEIRTRVKQAMIDLQITELKGKSNRYVLTKMPSKLVIQAEDEVPLDLKTTFQTVICDRQQIKILIEQGKEVPGACLEDVYALRQYMNLKGDK